jgi:hypothetical protein
MSTGTITSLSERIEAAKQAVTDEGKRHDAALAGLRLDLKLVEDERAHALAGTDPDVRLLASHVVEVKWHKNERHDEFDAGVVAAAITDLTADAVIMRKEYIGVKNYEGFIHQREDHKYGYGPRHGSIVFSVGLMPEVRKRLADGGELTEDEKDAAITYLLNLERAGVA